MNSKKLIVIILIFMLLLPSLAMNVSSKESDEDESFNESSEESFRYKLLRLRFYLGFLDTFGLGRYFIRQLRPPVPIQAYPESINLEYLNRTNFVIGGKNQENTDWEAMVKVAGTWNWAWMNRLITFSFEFVPPEGLPEDMWVVRFDPEKLILKPNRENLDWPGALDPFKTNVSIMLKPGVDPSIVTGDVVLKFNIVRTEALDKLSLLKPVPEFVTKYKDEYIQKCEDLGVPAFFYINPTMIPMYNLITRYTIFLMNMNLPYYEKWVDSTVEVLIKVEKYHQAFLEPISPQIIEPYQVKSIPLTITNLGSHIDTYNFNVRCDEEDMVVTPPSALTLRPGEQGEALVGIAAPKRLLSVGATTSIFVDAYSVDDPDTVFSQTVILSTSGVHATGGFTYNIVLLIITLIIVIGLYLYFVNKRRGKVCQRPDKPWELSDEKEYLEKLKKKDKKEYNEALKRMQEEYKSSLLWYNSYSNYTIKKKKEQRKKELIKSREEKLKIKEKIQKEKQDKTVKKAETKKKEKPKKEKPEIKKETKVKEPKPEPKEEKEIKEKPEIDKKAEEEKRRKEKALLKIKREQEKQKRKFG